MSNPNILDPNALQQAMKLQQSGEVARAAVIYRQLLRGAPSHPQLLYLLGTAELQQGNTEEGVQLLAKSVKLSPNQPRAHCNLGVGLHTLGREKEALAAYDRAVALNPGYAVAHNNRGITLQALGRQNEALACFERALALEPRYAEAHNNRGGIERERNQLEAALASFEQAIALNPNYAVAHCNRGTTLNELRRPDEALASLDRAIALDRGISRAHCARASALFNLKRLDEARASNERGLALEPGLAEAHWNGALLKLVAGDLAEGWELHEWRMKLDEWRSKSPWAAEPAAKPEQPLWTGEQPIAGRTLLVHYEQGLGDFVQFCRYVPMVRALGAQVIVEAKKRLLPLLTTLEGDYVFIERGSAFPDFDFYCPVMSLPRAFKTTLETIPAKVPYLFADRGKQIQVEARLGAKTMPRIGLVWSGNPGQKADPFRSIPLRLLAPLFDLPFAFHSLQKEIRPGDEAIMEAFRIVPHQDEQNDFSDAAALIACMDLVVTVDTAVAHVAGAMGKPVWILLAWMADWRWLLDRADSPWYPTARLFRQHTAGDWAGVIDDVTGRLRTCDFASGAGGL
jgi:tetratricopeptide (TPR) repeat protein